MSFITLQSIREFRLKILHVRYFKKVNNQLLLQLKHSLTLKQKYLFTLKSKIMKFKANISLYILILTCTLLFSSCGIHSARMTRNLNNHSTQVHLSQNNFKVLKSVKGESSATYIWIYGGFKKDGIVSEARSQMLSQANLVGGAKAIINENIEVETSFYWFVTTIKVIVTADVIEFVN